jgi:hypothetical protein
MQPRIPRIVTIVTPTGPMAVLRSVAERLLSEGVISGSLDGGLHAADAATVKTATMVHGVCDFCSAPGIEDGFDVPDFDMPGTSTRSTDGWATCGPCGELVRAGKRKELLKRSIDSLAFAKFTKFAIAELHERFWRGLDAMAEAVGISTGIVDFVEDRLSFGKPVLTDRDKRIDAIGKLVGLTVDEVQTLIRGDLPVPLATKLVAWGKSFGGKDARQVAELLAGGQPKPLPSIVPHWQRALDAKFEVLTMLQQVMKSPQAQEWFPDPVDLHDTKAVAQMAKMARVRAGSKLLGVDEDFKMIRGAQAYSFNAETEAAIMEAAKGIPHDAPLSSIETPNTGSGWFWFSAPLAVAASPMASDYTHALLWGWDSESKDPMLQFSAYVLDEKGRGKDQAKLYPSTHWKWPLSMSFHDMLGLNTLLWRDLYGPGAPLEHDPLSVGEDAHRKVIADLSLFFVMACLWFRQTVAAPPILTKESGHVERHARKRYQREHQLTDVPTVQVIALRKTARTVAAEAPPERADGAREYHCQWIVIGHTRLQPCGPGRTDRKLIWISPHLAGPPDKPLKTKTKVYAVVR